MEKQHLTRLRKAAAQRTKTRAKDDQAFAELADAIRDAAHAGLSYRTIAEAARVSHQRVAQIVKTETERP